MGHTLPYYGVLKWCTVWVEITSFYVGAWKVVKITLIFRFNTMLFKIFPIPHVLITEQICASVDSLRQCAKFGNMQIKKTLRSWLIDGFYAVCSSRS